jgi:hypothetical protein
VIGSLNGTFVLQMVLVLALLGGGWWIGRIIKKRVAERDAAPAPRESDKIGDSK